ncbi:Transposon Ty3-I Gag-Pol polyprotein, partial [Araneus ventricosus]
EVKTKGSFQREIELDGEKYSVTWHVVPTPYLEFQAVIGSDILEQAFVGFDRKGVYFRKHEDKVWFMHTQVYEARIEDEIEVKHVTNPRIRKELSELINNYIPKKTETTNVSMRIILKDDVPVYQPARRLSFPENQAVNKQIDEWFDQGIVRQSSSEYASPIVLVKKKDGTARLCADYRKLNRKLVKDRFPLPLIEDVLDKLQDAKVYSTLDLKNGFFHVEVNEDCKHFTSFVVPDGQFEFNKQGKTTELHSDASQQGYGAVLLQEAEDGKLHPVQYMSKKTTPAEEKYNSYELEVLAVVNALRKFRTYLMGNYFKIITDCSAFQRTMDKKDLVTRIARWALLLEEFAYEIVHRSGQRMQHVDALSRYPVAIITSDTLTARLKRAQQEDEYTQSLRSMIGSNNDSDFFDKNEILY